MNIDYEVTLTAAAAIDQQDTFNDVIKKVTWLIGFFDTANPTIKSNAAVESYLNTDSLSSDTYVPYANVTQTQILQWALDAEGGTAFLDQLLEGGHAVNLEKLVNDAAYTEKDISLLAES